MGVPPRVKMNSVVKQLLYILKLFRVTAGCRGKETFRIMYPKYSVLDMIQRNPPPLRIIWINNPLFDFSKETIYPFSD